MGKTEPKDEPTEDPKPDIPESDNTIEVKPKKEKKEKSKKKSPKVKYEEPANDEQPADKNLQGEPSTTPQESTMEPEKHSKKREKSSDGKPKKRKAKGESGSAEATEALNKTEETIENVPTVPQSEDQPDNVTTAALSTANPSTGSVPGSTGSLKLPSKDTSTIVFVDELDASYRCISCGEPLRVPILFQDCGHRCCSGCLPNLMRGSSRCPSDNTHLKQDHIKMDKEFQLQMDNLAVRCTFNGGGCPWTGKLAQLGGHLNHCGHRVIDCPNGCGVEFEQRYVEQHLADDCPKRAKKCKFCDATLMAANELKHIGVCPKFPVSCPNGCKVHEIPRSQLTEHLTSECSKQELPCPFATHGCKFRGRKKKIEPHVLESCLEHLSLVNSSMQQMSLLMEAQTKSFTDLKMILTQQAKRIAGLERCFGAAFTWKIDNYLEKFNMAKSGKQTTIFSPAFYTHRCGYRMAMSVCLFGSGEARGKFMSVFVCLCRGDHDALLPWPFTYQLTFTMLDQHSDVTLRKPVDYTIKPNPTAEQNMFLGRPTGDRNACFGAPRFVKLETIKTSEYIVDDSLFLKVSLSLDDLAAG